jgi:phospholipid/cholesterol/gamma-HCH transport system substrate-binding protein
MSNDVPPRGVPEDDEELTQPKLRRNREVLVGAFVILGMAAVVGILFTFTDAAMFRQRFMVTTNVPDAGGIRRGDPVRMRGVNIGRVMEFKIVETGVDIRLEIEGEYPVPKDSEVRLVSAGLIGGMMANVVPGRSPEMAGYGDRLKGSTEGDITSSTERLADEADKVLKSAQDLLSKGMIDDVHGSATEMNALMKRLSETTAEQRDHLRELSNSLKRSAANFEPSTLSAQRAASSAEKAAANVETLTARPELTRAVERLDALTARLDETTKSFDAAAKSLETVTSRMDRGEGTLGKLSRDDALYNNLNKAVQSFQALAEDIKKQPKRYFDVSVF